MADKNLKTKKDEGSEEVTADVDLNTDLSDLYTQSTEDLAAEELEDFTDEEDEDGLEDFADVDIDTDAESSEEFEEGEE